MPEQILWICSRGSSFIAQSMQHCLCSVLVTVQDSPKHLLLRAYESVNEVASGDSGCEASPDA